MATAIVIIKIGVKHAKIIDFSIARGGLDKSNAVSFRIKTADNVSVALERSSVPGCIRIANGCPRAEVFGVAVQISACSQNVAVNGDISNELSIKRGVAAVYLRRKPIKLTCIADFKISVAVAVGSGLIAAADRAEAVFVILGRNAFIVNHLGVFAVCIVVSRIAAKRSGIYGVIHLHSAEDGNSVNAELLTPRFAHIVSSNARSQLCCRKTACIIYCRTGVQIIADIKRGFLGIPIGIVYSSEKLAGNGAKSCICIGAYRTVVEAIFDLCRIISRTRNTAKLLAILYTVLVKISLVIAVNNVSSGKTNDTAHIDPAYTGGIAVADVTVINTVSDNGFCDRPARDTSDINLCSRDSGNCSNIAVIYAILHYRAFATAKITHNSSNIKVIRC